MAYKKDTKEMARRLYVVEGKAIVDIATIMGIPVFTIHKWKVKFEWDKEICSGGNVSLYLNMQKQFSDAVELAIAQNKLADPSTADALWKTAKLMDRLMPEKVLLSNISNFLEDTTRFFVANVSNPDFIEVYQEFLPKLADFLRSKYTSE